MAAIRLLVHVSEPWDFERLNGTNELTGWTEDHEDEELEEWVVTLDRAYEVREDRFQVIKVSPRLVGEDIRRALDGFTYTAVNICHMKSDDAQDDDWHYSMVGSIRPAPQDETPSE